MADYSWITVAQTKGSCILLPSCQKAKKWEKYSISNGMKAEKGRRNDDKSEIAKNYLRNAF